MKTTLASSRAAALAAVFLSVAPLLAQEPPASPAPPEPAADAATPAPAPTPVPTPLPILMEGPALDTLRALSAALATESKHTLDGTMAAANAGRATRMFMPGLRMFSRRTEWLHRSIEEYRAKPFDVTTTVTGMSTRVGGLARRMKNNPALQHTHEDWDTITDLLDRMKKLLAGEAVTVPPPHTPRPAPTPAVPALLAPNPSPKAPAPSPAPTPTPSPQ